MMAEKVVVSGDMVEYEVIVTDKDGRVIHREKGPSKSYLKAFNQQILIRFSASTQTIKDVGGVDRAIINGFYLMGTAASAGDTNKGIRFGSGNTAVDISDYALETPIAEGTGAGQLSHLACTVTTPPSVDATTSSFPVKRVGVNGTGDNVTVREIGVYVSGRTYVGGPYYYMCIVRDVLGSPVTIPDGGAITVIYTFKAVE